MCRFICSESFFRSHSTHPSSLKFIRFIIFAFIFIERFMCSEVLLQMFNDLEAYGTFIAGTFRRLAIDCESVVWKVLM